MIEEENRLASEVRTPHAPLSRALEVISDARVRELEIENQRLQFLVAELLIKNQQLRKQQLSS
jgi:hypothetical protein